MGVYFSYQINKPRGTTMYSIITGIITYTVIIALGASVVAFMALGIKELFKA